VKFFGDMNATYYFNQNYLSGDIDHKLERLRVSAIFAKVAGLSLLRVSPAIGRIIAIGCILILMVAQW